MDVDRTAFTFLSFGFYFIFNLLNNIFIYLGGYSLYVDVSKPKQAQLDEDDDDGNGMKIPLFMITAFYNSVAQTIFIGAIIATYLEIISKMN
jgi:hypothetical protein